MTLKVSIIINNYNYAEYLVSCIESALAQTYSNTEVIVADDGSTDNSRAIIESYGSSVIPTFKLNGGQASALNAGYKRSSGDLRERLVADGTVVTMPTSGNVFPRAFLDQVMPMPEVGWERDADAYLLNLAALSGEVGAIDKPLGSY